MKDRNVYCIDVSNMSKKDAYDVVYGKERSKKLRRNDMMINLSIVFVGITIFMLFFIK